jgi:hypothetical protein
MAGSLFAFIVSGAALAADVPSPPNYQGLWWNSPAGSESGWGINLAHQGDVIFATWFTYDAAGEGWWLAMTANKTAEGTYSGSLVEAAGPGFQAIPFDPARVTRTAAGTGTLTFRDADNGTFAWSVKGAQQTKSITRYAFGTAPTCTYAAQPELATAPNYQDIWWASGGGESGWGINLAHQGDTIVATWFTYDRDGTPLWLSVTAPRIAQGVYGGPIVKTTGPAFNAPTFDATRVTRTVAGSATLSFSNGNAAAFAYTMDGVSRTKAITRLLFAPPAGTRCAVQPAATVKGRVFDAYLEGALVCADANRNGRCDPGEGQALTDASGSYDIPAPAAYAGPLVAEIAAGRTRDGGTPVDRPYRMASPSRDYATNITPFTTIVHLARQPDVRLAEEIARNELGLPPRFQVNLGSAPADGTFAKAVSKAVVSALKDVEATLDYAAPDALATVVAAFPPALTELPHLHIRTKGAAPIVSREEYLDATFTLVYPAESLPSAELNGRIRGRGNTTWWGAKKPYKVQFTNDASYAKVPDFLGMRKNRNWALLADYYDRSLMRNKLAFTLANSSVFADGLKWTPSGQHLEVTVNGDYVGVYLLNEDIRIDSARLNIKKMSTSPAAGQLDGGYIVEVDQPLDCYNDGLVNLQHHTPLDTHICVDKPDEEDITQAQLAYVKGFLDRVETDIYARADLSRINAVSFADWYLVSELFRNQDAVFYSSDFMWKDTDAATIPADRLLNMGPLWDFDLSAGNVNMFENWKPEGCWVAKTLPGQPNWIAKLLENRDFLDLVIARWKDKRPSLEAFVSASIGTFTRRLEAPQQRNFARWPVLGTAGWNNYYLWPAWSDEVAYLKGFLTERMAWLDRAYASPGAFAALCR